MVGIDAVVKQQPVNAFLAILVTEFGIVILVRPSQPLNAYSPIVVRESESVIFVRFSQSQVR